MIPQLLAGPRPRVQIRYFLLVAIPLTLAGLVLFALGDYVAALVANTLMLIALAVTGSRCWTYLQRRNLWISHGRRLAFAVVDLFFWWLAALSLGTLGALLGLDATTLFLVVVGTGVLMIGASVVRP